MGGGAFRTAAKAAIYRSPAIFGAGTTAAHRFPWPGKKYDVNASLSSSPSDIGLSSLTLEESRPEASSLRPAIDVDDWEFAGWSSDDEMNDVPRLVFGPLPTFEEAKAATNDLKDAMERANIAQTTTEHPVVTGPSILPEASTIIPKMPKHVVQAFSFLQGSPEAQDVVASLACDKNVWDAVVKNEKVMEFYNKNKSVLSTLDSEDVADNYGSNVSTESDIESPVSSVFEDLVQSFKLKVEEVVNNISSFFQDIMGSSSSPMSIKTIMQSRSDDIPVGVGATFFALAVATILVVLFKRE